MSLFYILIFLVFVIFFGVALLFLSSLLGPKKVDHPRKADPYECGLESEEPPVSQVPVKFYLTAILFILFDIEIIFMYPWAISFSDFIRKGQGLELFGIIGFFLFIFIFGLIWEVRSRALDWK